MPGPRVPRADIAELLRAGHSDRAIAKQLHVDARKTVAPLRSHLGIPKTKSGPTPAASVEELFWRRATPTDDGHMEWNGTHGTGNVPTLRHGGRQHSAYRVAFRIANGRDPEGYALPSCGRDGCVKPGHHADRRDREQAEHVNALYEAIFGEAA